MIRKEFIATLSHAAFASSLFLSQSNAQDKNYTLNFILSSAMYGDMNLADVLKEVTKIGSRDVDLWPKAHANHREQANEMGMDAFKTLIKENQVNLKCMTCYNLGPFNLQKEMEYAQNITGSGVIFVCGARGPKNLSPGNEMKLEIKKFIELLKPQIESATQLGMFIAIENHDHSLIHTKDSMLWFAEMAQQHDCLGIAFAPHHLQTAGLNATDMGNLIRQLDHKVSFFYAQQYGIGSKQVTPKEVELLQMPGRGDLDFTPLIAALKHIQYHGPVSIFMHPTPRGKPILASIAEVTAEINLARTYLLNCLDKVS